MREETVSGASRCACCEPVSYILYIDRKEGTGDCGRSILWMVQGTSLCELRPHESPVTPSFYLLYNIYLRKEEVDTDRLDFIQVTSWPLRACRTPLYPFLRDFPLINFFFWPRSKSRERYAELIWTPENRNMRGNTFLFSFYMTGPLIQRTKD